MTATALVTGKLAKAPERKTSKSGKPYGVANVRVGAGDAVTWWRVMVFEADEIELLMALSAGETVSASGSFNAEVYDSKKDGSTFTLLADAVLVPRKRKRGRADMGRADRSGSYSRREGLQS
jgi:hypothetical protein